MTTTLPTRQQIESADTLEFDTPRPSKRQRGVAILLTYHGAPVEFSFAAENAPTVNEIEQSIDTLLKRDGWGVPQTASANGKKPAAERVKPLYDGAGEPCCPVHRKPLKEGNWGLYCSAKDRETGEYCKLKFEA